MEGKTILCAIDFSESSLRALRWTLHEAQLVDASVTILFCYRLIPDQQNSFLELKKSIEQDANQKFQQIESNMIKGKGPAYQFITEVGFFSSRITSIIDNFPVSMVVMGTSLITNLNDNQNAGFEEFLQRSAIPVVIVPDRKDEFLKTEQQAIMLGHKCRNSVKK